jgi:tetratricopeptide (TPR) repeat protein
VVLSVAAVAAALLIGVVAFDWQATVARHQRDRAVRAESEATMRADQLKLVSDFQEDMLGQIDPNRAGEELTEDVITKLSAALANADPPLSEAARAQQVADFTMQWSRVNATDAARELIDRTILRPAIVAVDTRFKDQPAVDAQLRHVLAEQYRVLGLYDAAMPLQEAALATRRRVLGEEHPDTLVSLNDMGYLLLAKGMPAEAEAYFREALEKMQRVLGEEHRDTLTAMDNLAQSLQAQGRLDEAEAIYREALDGRRHAFGDDDPDTVIAINNLGFVLLSQGRLAEAEPLLREAVAKFRTLRGDDHPDTVSAINNLAYVIQYQGRPAEAEPLLREALDRSRRILGEDHPFTLLAMNNLGLLLQDLNQFGEAELVLRAAMEGRRRVLGEDHPNTLITTINTGTVVESEGRHTDAEQLLSSVESSARTAFTGSYRTWLAKVLTALGRARTHLGDFPAAETNLLEAHSLWASIRGEDHKDTRNCTKALAELYTAWETATPGEGHEAQAAQWKAARKDGGS